MVITADELERRSPSSTRNAMKSPYMDRREREEQFGYALSEIPRIQQQRASLVRRRRNTVFPTISNKNPEGAESVQHAAPTRVSFEENERGKEGNEERTNTSVIPLRKSDPRRNKAGRGRETFDITQAPAFQRTGQKSSRIGNFLRFLYPAKERLETRLFRTASYVFITWFAAFWLVYGGISLVTLIHYGPAHTTQKTAMVDGIPYSVSAYLQSGTVVVTVLEERGTGWKTFTTTTPPLNSNFWGDDPGAIVPIITSVSPHGVIQVQLIGNIDWRFHRQTEIIQLVPQPDGTFVLSLLDPQG